MTSEMFCTDDMDAAAYIASKRGDYWNEYGWIENRVYFYFDNPNDARQLRNEYLRGGLVVAQDFVAWRNKAVACKYARG